jgi:hypothetical protein
MKKVLLTLGLGALGIAAHAQVINTYPEFSGEITDGWFGTAQTFAAPASELVSYQFGISGAASGNNLTVSLYNWTANAPVGSALFSTTVAWPTSSGDVLINNIDAALTTGDEYGVVVDFNGYSGESENFVTKSLSDPNPTGHGYWSDAPTDSTQWNAVSTLDTEFMATFSPAPEPFTVIGLGIGCVALVRRRIKAKA